MKRGIGLRYALAGLLQAVRTERNMRIHLAAACGAVAVAAFAGLDRDEWLWVLLAIAFVISTELVNTALERLADFSASGRSDPLVKAAKDMGAASVLVAACFAVVVGAVVLVPALIGRFS